jgi:shikimate kinase
MVARDDPTRTSAPDRPYGMRTASTLMSDALPTAILIGLRGSGKSTLASLLASKLELPSRDLDVAVLARLGVASVEEAFRARGEPAFRDAESIELEAALAEPGGGTPFVVGAREAIEAAKRRGSTVVWIDAPDQVLAARIAAGRDRPALLGSDAAAEVAALRSQRQRTYRALADLRVDTEAFTSEHAAAAILQCLRDRASSR